MKTLLSLLLIFVVITNSNCARILGIFNMPSKSHHILGENLLKGLAAKGHHVTMLSPYSSKNLLKNYEEIVISDLLKGKDEFMKILLNEQNNFFIQKFRSRLNYQIFLENSFLNLTIVQDLISAGVQYDLAIVVWFGNDAVLAFAQRLANHTIVFSTLGSHYQISKLTKTPTPPSYIPNLLLHLHLPLPDEMIFIERLQNFLLFMFSGVFKYFIAYQHRLVIDKFIPNSPSVDQIYEHVSLVLINTHYSLESSRPYVPQIIQVGGLQLQESTELSGNLKTIMDEATDGAILFSLGSNVKSSDLDKKTLRGIITCFSKLPYKVFWKFEQTNLLNLPENVIINNWFPQKDLLAHKNMKLFITHGGLLSTTEAVYFGVPMIGIPLYGDQYANVIESVLKGYAIRVSYLDLSEEILSNAITEVMNNPKYRNNIQQRSRVFRDQPVKALETAVFWVEYVLRHDGAHHLKTSAFKLHWVQQYSIDVIVVICIVIYGFILAVRKILNSMCKFLCKCNGELNTNKQKEKPKKA